MIFCESPSPSCWRFRSAGSGIGFVGGGAILKEGGNVRGLATAASIWVTGAIGAAVALGREEIAVVLSLATFAMLRFLSPIAETNSSEKNSRAEGGESD